MSIKLGTNEKERLRDIGLFGGLSDEALEQLAGALEVIVLEPGSVVFNEGDSGREMFVLLEGEIEVLKHSKSLRETRVALLGPSDWFGEMSILDVMPRSATVRTLSPSRVLRITAHDLDALYRRDLRAYSLVVLNIAREMSRRLRVVDGLLAEFVANVVDEYTRSHRTS
jgi:CRP/FNR family transcriptional regulator, cyclic AMP receptor protein